MDIQLTTHRRAALREVFIARYARLQHLHAMLTGVPDSVGTRWRQKLVAHALYSTWEDMESLKALPV